MAKPKLLPSDGIYIDSGCHQITYLSSCVAVPTYVGCGWEQAEYLKELNEFLIKWFEIDYEIGKNQDSES